MATTKKATTSKRSTSTSGNGSARKRTTASGDGSATKRTSSAGGRTAGRTTGSAPAGSDDGRSSGDAPRASARKKKSGIAVAGEAARQLLELTGREVEGVTGLQRSDDGWKVQVEVVEVRRIPDTTDVLALYELDVDADGDLEGYRRLRRYARGVPGED